MSKKCKELLRIVHNDVALPDEGKTYFCKGDYEYWHYGCDGVNDQGWGCGYRTLQTIASWIIKNETLNKTVPSIKEIQEILVSIEDKGPSFIGSRQWIGSFEVCLVLDTLYDIQSKVVHIPNQESFEEKKLTLVNHFANFSSPVMMGGDKDCSSKGIVGVHQNEENTYLLIVDPHFVGKAKSTKQLIDTGYLYWKNIKDLDQHSFYNICFPQVRHVERRQMNKSEVSN